MAQVASSYAFTNPLQVLTREGIISEKVIDTNFKSIKILQYLRSKGMVDDKKGAAALTWTVNTGASPNTLAFSGDDTLPINSMNNNLQRAAINWKSYADALVLLVEDLLDNDGSPEAIANLVDVQMGITQMSLVKTIASDIIVNTNAINAKGLNGLAEAVDDGTVAGNYASLSRSTFGSKWKSQVNYNAASTANLVNTIHTLDLNSSVDGQRPDAYFCTPAIFGSLIQALIPSDRYAQPELARTTGGVDAIFNGNPVFIDHQLPTAVAVPTGVSAPGSGSNSGGYFYGLNSTYLKFVVNPNANFRAMDFEGSHTNATVFSRIITRANLACLKPSAHFVLWFQGG